MEQNWQHLFIQEGPTEMKDLFSPGVLVLFCTFIHKLEYISQSRLDQF